DAPRRARHPFADARAVGDERAHDDEIRAADVAREALLQLGQARVHLRPRVWRAGQVAVVAVPGLFALQEQDLVPARVELAGEAPVRGRVAVAPGGGDRQAEDDALQGGTGRPARIRTTGATVGRTSRAAHADASRGQARGAVPSRPRTCS